MSHARRKMRRRRIEDSTAQLRLPESLEVRAAPGLLLSAAGILPLDMYGLPRSGERPAALRGQLREGLPSILPRVNDSLPSTPTALDYRTGFPTALAQSQHVVAPAEPRFGITSGPAPTTLWSRIDTEAEPEVAAHSAMPRALRSDGSISPGPSMPTGGAGDVGGGGGGAGGPASTITDGGAVGGSNPSGFEFSTPLPAQSAVIASPSTTLLPADPGGRGTADIASSAGNSSLAAAAKPIGDDPSLFIPLGFDDGLAGWTVREAGGTTIGKGNVQTQGDSVVLREGDSFLVSLEHTFVVPANPTVLSFSYSDLVFDKTDANSINDAFEVSLVDSDESALVHAFAKDRDAFFNLTDGLAVATGTGTSVQGTRVSTDISGLFPGSTATLIFRLVNNDADKLTSVRLSDAQLGEPPLEVALRLVNDTAPDGPGADVYRTDKLTNDPRLHGTVLKSGALQSLELQLDAAPFVDALPLLVGETFEFDPGQLAPGAHTATLRGSAVGGEVVTTRLEFRQNAPPVAKAGEDLRISEGGLVQLDGSQSSDAEGLFSFKWILTDGTTSSESSISRVFPQDGAFKIGLLVTDTAGSTHSDDVLVEVDNVPPVITPIGDYHIAAGQTVDLKAFISDAGKVDQHTAKIAWGDGTIEPLSVTGSGPKAVVGAHTFTKAGTYESELIVSDEAASASTRFMVHVEAVIPSIVPSAVRDDGDWAYRERGLWERVPFDGAYQGDYRRTVGRDGAADSATWTLTGLPGRYEVFATWPEDEALATATYTIRDGNALLGTAARNQAQSPVDGRYDGRLWASLGTFDFESGVGTVTLSSPAGQVIADGLAWVPAATDLRANAFPVPTPRPAAIPTAPDDSIEILDLAPFEKTSLEVGTRFVVSGRAVAGAAAGGVAYVTVNGKPVDALDASGNFFHAVEALPGPNTLEVVAVAKNAARQVATIAFNGVRVEGIDLDQLADVSGSIVAEYGRTSLSQQSADPLGGRGDTLHAALALRNRGIYPVRAPLLVGVKSLSDPTVLVRGAAGHTAEGIPYYDFSSLLAGDVLSPTQKTAEGLLEFYNPQHVRFTYELVILGLLNRSPLVTTAPNVEAIVGPYTYDLAATDPDGDPLTYSLLNGPRGLSIDRVSGAVRWAPTEPDLGNHVVAIRVEDGQGGAVEQRFTLSAIVAPPNRPPVFVSQPEVSAEWNRVYEYEADAKDPDQDALSYALLFGPAGMQVAPTTRRVTWTPELGAPFSLQSQFGDRDNFGTGLPTNVAPPLNQIRADASDGLTDQYLSSGIPRFDWSHNFVVPSGAKIKAASLTIVTLDVEDKSKVRDNRLYLDGREVLGAFDEVASFCPENCVGQTTHFTLGADFFPLLQDGAVAVFVDAFAGSLPDAISIDYAVLEMDFVYGGEFPVILQATDGRGGVAQQAFTIVVQNDSGNRPPVIVSEPPGRFDIPGSNSPPAGTVNPSSVTLELGPGESATSKVSVTLPTTVPTKATADVVFLVDESYLMESRPTSDWSVSGPSRQAWVADAALQLDTALQAQGFEDNRFGLVGFGGAAPNPLPVAILDSLDFYSIAYGGYTNHALSLTPADLDRDGDMDFVSASDFWVFTYVNDGTGHFSLTPYGAGAYATQAAVADVNDDTIPDVIVGGYIDSWISVLLGRGDGSFADPITSATPGAVYNIATDDLDGNGTIDLVLGAVADVNAPNFISIMLGDGAGRFTVGPSFPIGSYWSVRSTAVGDVDNDGDLDVLVYTDVGSAAILFGDGAGHFNQGAPIPFQGGMSVTLADVNEDAILDIIDTGQWYDLQVHLGIGNGTFRQAVGYKQGTLSVSAFGDKHTRVADANADGHVDLISISTADSVSVLLGDGSGAFEERVDYMVGPGLWSIAVADVDGDGAPDLISGFASARVSILRGSPEGLFKAPAIRYGVLDSVQDMTTADMDGDGHVDIVAIGRPVDVGTNQITGNAYLAIAFGNGVGGFRARAEFDAGPDANRLALGDIDQDGDLDIATNGTNGAVRVFTYAREVGLLTLNAVYDREGAFGVNQDIELVDVTGDSRLDILSVDAVGHAMFWKGLSGGQFEFAHLLGIDTSPELKAADLNDDSVVDLVTLQAGGVAISLGTGGGSFAPPTIYASPPANAFAIGDLDHDGDIDIVTAGGGFATALLNSGTGAFSGTAPAAVPQLHSVGGIAVADLNGDLNLDLVATRVDGIQRGAVNVAFGNGVGSFSFRGAYEGLSGATNVWLGDLDEDGDTDFMAPSDFVLDAVSIGLNDGYGDFGRFGTAQSFASASGALTSAQGTGDGYAAIETALKYAIRQEATTYFVLVTTSERAALGGTSVAAMRDELAARGILLHVVVDAVFQDGQQTSALGVDAEGNAIVPDGAGGYSVQPGGQFISGEGKVDYVDLAWGSDGVAWDLNQLMQGGSSVAIQAFVQQSVEGLGQRIPVTVVSSDSSVRFENLTGPIVGVGTGESATFDVRFTGDGAAHVFDLLFVQGDAGQIVGSIPVRLNADYVYRPRAIDPDGDSIQYALLEAPDGARIDAATGEVRWVPTTIGAYPFRVEASDGRGGKAVQAFRVDVTRGAPNASPVIETPTPGPATAGRAYSLPVVANDPDGDVLSYYLSGSPANMTIDRATGVIQWMPRPEQVGAQQVAVVVLDGRGGRATSTFSIQVAPEPRNLSPRISSSPVVTARTGEPYVYRSLGNDLNGDPLAWSLAVAPPGMVVDPASGAVVWTPAAYQSVPIDVVLQLKDGQGGFDLQRYQIQLELPNTAPVILSTSRSQPVVGLPHQLQVLAQDGENDPLEYSLAKTLPGMHIDAVSGLLEWTATADQVGERNVVVRVSDGRGGLAERSLTFVVVASAANTPPLLGPIPHLFPRIDADFRYELVALDPDGDPLTFQLEAPPAGMTLGTDGVLRWQPTPEQAQEHRAQIRVTDGRGGEAFREFAITPVAPSFNRRPTITSMPPLTAVVGLTYGHDFQAFDEDGEQVVWALTSGPTGMSLDPTRGTLRWTPVADQIGENLVIVHALDGQAWRGGAVIGSFTITVRAANTPPQILAAPPTVAPPSALYKYAVSASDIDGDTLAFTLDAGPAGMIVDRQLGIVQWAPLPSEAGAHNVAVRVEDGVGGVAVQTYTLVVPAGPVNQPPVIISAAPFRGTAGSVYEYDVVAADPEGALLSYTLPTAPVGMTINPTTGRIAWTPTGDAVGTHRVEIEARDPGGAWSRQSYALSVLGSNANPTIISVAPLSAVPAAPYRYDVRADDSDGDSLQFTLAAAPPGMKIDPLLGRIDWSPSAQQLGKHAVQVQVSDGRGGSTSQAFEILVGADTDLPRVAIQVDRTSVGVGEQLAVTVTATDNIGVEALSLLIAGQEVPLDAAGRATVTMNTAGPVSLIASARDAAGNVGQGTLNVSVLIPDASSPLTVLTAPDDESVITSPTDVVGSVTDDNLVSYSLSVVPVEGGAEREVARGTQPVSNGTLGRFDPTLLANGSYWLRLTAMDAGGNESVDERLVHVAGELKLGNFTTSFTDLTVPVTGVPITVTRTYDSLQAGSADEFGFGWRLEFRDVDLRTSVLASDLEDVDIYNAFYDGARVYVTLPGGKREGFTFRPELLPGPAGPLLGLFKPKFEPDPGVTSRLTVPDHSLMALETGDFVFYGEALAYNPASTLVNGGGHYYLTTEDGLAYDIDAQTGDLLVVTDNNGATLTFTDEAITSSTGKRATFERDPQGRITAVIDPAGQKVRYAYDVHGDLSSVVDREGNTTRFEYHPTRPHYLTKIVDALGRAGVRTEYDENGRLVKLVDAAGQPIEQRFDLANSAVTVVNQLGYATKYEYDSRGNVTRETDAERGVTQRTYDAANNLLEEIDANGKSTRFSYDDRGNVLSETDPLGRTTQTTHQSFTRRAPISGVLLAPPFSRPATTIDATGHATVNEYDESGNLLSIAGQAAGVTRLSYDPQGNLTTLFDGAGTTRFEYDGAGQVIRQFDAAGRETTYTYDSSGRQLTETKTLTTASGPRTLVTRTEYDGEGRVVKSTDAEGGVTETLYDAVGNRIAVVDPLGRTTKYRYSDRGELIETILPDARPLTDADNPRTQTVYDAAGQVVAEIDESGRRTEYRYDKVGRKTATIFADDTPDSLEDNPRQQTEYDAAGRVLAQIDERGNRTEHRYADDGQETETILPDGTPADPNDNPRLKYEYDAAGRRVAALDPLGRRTEFVYSDLGQLTTTTYADGATTTSQFDDRGQLVGRTDQLGHQTQYQYDASRRLSAVVDAVGGRTEYGYDELGNLVSQTDASGHATLYEYDGLGRRTATVLPLGQRSTSVYDKVGNVASTTDFNGQSITFDYDERNRLTAKHYSDQSVVRFTYTPTGQRASVVDARGETRYEHDARERLLARTDPDGRQIHYTYDAAGNRTSLTAPSGTVQYTFDALNRTETVVDPEGGLTRYTYDPAGNLIRTQLPNGTSELREYDELGRLLYLENQGPAGVINSFRYTLDDKGQRTRVAEQDARTVDYLYDNLDRLVREAITDTALGNRTLDYTYDAVGNRQTRNDSVEGQTTYQYDANDRLLAEILAGQETKYAYDSNGNTLSKLGPVDRAFYEWDADNRLIAADVTEGGATTHLENRYNADGIRVSQSVDGQETRYLLDTVQPYAQVHEEYTSGGIIKVSYVYGNDLVSQNRSGAKTFYHVDGLGSTRALSDAAGAATDRYVYDAFGRTIHQVGSTGNLYLFAGEQRDAGLGMDYLRARYMDPGLGRFVSRDPFAGVVQEPISLHPYLYADSNPASNMDPTGRFTLGGVVAALVLAPALTSALTLGLPTLFGGPVEWTGSVVSHPIAQPFTVLFGASRILMNLSAKQSGQPNVSASFEILTFDANLGFTAATASDVTVWTPSIFGDDPRFLMGPFFFAGIEAVLAFEKQDFGSKPKGLSVGKDGFYMGFGYGSTDNSFGLSFSLQAGFGFSRLLPYHLPDLRPYPRRSFE